jgi:hypothetical protein
MILSAVVILMSFTDVEMYCDHAVTLDSQGRLQPWTSFDHVIRGSMNFLEHCPTAPTKFGDDPWYLISSIFTEEGEFKSNQNNQGCDLFFAAETIAKYYAYSGDKDSFQIIRNLADRILMSFTPDDWVWSHVPRTQDDVPDGDYSDEKTECDKVCMVGLGYIRFYKMTGEQKYLDAALEIARVIASKIAPGDEDYSPIPFRVNAKTGVIIDPYTANMAAVVDLFQTLIALGYPESGAFAEKRDIVIKWLIQYPLANYIWSGYYEDVGNNRKLNFNQQLPLETARYMMRHPELFPDWKTQVPALIQWTRDRFGKTKRHGASSICEQDRCFAEMSSHTARYASVVAQWWGISGDSQACEEARASFALTTYSTFAKSTKDERAVNYVGVGYSCPWFSDSYFDFLTHIFDGMAQMPDMAPADENHMLASTSTIKNISYEDKRIQYDAFDPSGDEILRLTFKPVVLVDGNPLDSAKWSYGEYHGVSNIMRIQRDHATHVEIKAAD